MKCFVIPVIIGATGIVSKILQIYLETVPGQHSIDSLQKTAILGTSHIIRKVLQAETWSLSGRVHHWLKRRSTREERKPVTRKYHNNNKCNSKEQKPSRRIKS
jgi:Co/Zn/Cd efflux system component